jgi:glycerol-1-phosphate dehydrogenase [NAD(P)+]
MQSLPLEPIDSPAAFLALDSAGLAGKILACPLCGREHSVPIGKIAAGRGLAADAGAAWAAASGKAAPRAAVIYDRGIEEIIQRAFLQPWARRGLDFRPVGLGGGGDWLDSETGLGDAAADGLDPRADLLVGTGSGVICDLTKWMATRLDKPYLLYGTAPSMNGYTSITATMTENEIKTSRFLNPAQAVYLDVDVLMDAPARMVQAGVGDLAARAVCNADWRLGQLLRGSLFCPLPYQMTELNQQRLFRSAGGIARREAAAFQDLAEAVLMSGLSMTVMHGETSPSSGAEHAISHFWDLLVHLRGLPKNLHGAQVGVGTLMVLAVYDGLRKLDPGKIDPQRLARRRPGLEEIAAENRARYGSRAADFDRSVAKKHLPDAAYRDSLRAIQAGWEGLWTELERYLTPLDEVRAALNEAGVGLRLADVQRSRDEGREALLYASRYRERYTILDLAWELGYFPDGVDAVLERAGV